MKNLSVIMPVFNARRYLRKAVLSILSEKVEDTEILVIDDGSTDSSTDTIRDLPVKIVRSKKNRGISYARNLGLKLMTGRKVAFLDSDDLLFPGGLRWRSTWLDRHPTEVAVAGTIAATIDCKGKVQRYSPDIVSYCKKMPCIMDWEQISKGTNFLLPLGSTMFRTEVFREIGRFSSSHSYADDYEIMLRFLRKYRIPYLQKKVFKYRVHQNNTTVRAVSGRLKWVEDMKTLRFLAEITHGIYPQIP